MTARTFAGTASLWSSLAPTLESVVHWLNSHLERKGERVAAIGGDPAKNSLIAETAFGLVSAGADLELPLDDLVLSQVRAYLNQFRSHPPGDVPLDDDEQEEVVGLANALSLLLSDLGDPVFYVAIPGCGIVPKAYADVEVGSTLIEVKSVSRPFRASDVKQLLTYAAMAAASGIRYDTLTLLNPRQASRVSVSTEFLCRGASGVTSVEFFGEVQRAMLGLQTSV